MKDCCITWKEMSKEVSVTEVAKLDALVEKGTPRYALAVAYAQMASMGNYCPSCGFPVKEGVAVRPKMDFTNPKPPVVETRTAQNTCAGCKGSGYTSGVAGVGAKHMPCLGLGFFNKDNTASRPMSAEKQGKLISVTHKIEKEKKPLREDAKPENYNK